MESADAITAEGKTTRYANCWKGKRKNTRKPERKRKMLRRPGPDHEGEIDGGEETPNSI